MSYRTLLVGNRNLSRPNHCHCCKLTYSTSSHSCTHRDACSMSSLLCVLIRFRSFDMWTGRPITHRCRQRTARFTMSIQYLSHYTLLVGNRNFSQLDRRHCCRLRYSTSSHYRTHTDAFPPPRYSYAFIHYHSFDMWTVRPMNLRSRQRTARFTMSIR